MQSTTLFTDEQKQVNLEENLKFLNELRVLGYIDDDTILVSKETLKKINPFVHIQDWIIKGDNFDEIVEEYLEQTTQEEGVKASENEEYKDDLYLEKIEVPNDDALKKLESNLYVKYENWLMNSSFGFVSGNKDREIQESRLTYANAYVRDERFAHWPINQICQLPLFAAMGPIPEVLNPTISHQLGMYLSDFFHAVLHDQHKISHIVALGIVDVDFINYFAFDTPKELVLVNSENKPIKIKLVSECIDVDDNNFLSKYKLNISCYTHNDSQYATEPYLSKEVHVINIAIPDGDAIQLSEKANLTFHDDLLHVMKQKEGVLVHCRAGLGRTGQIIAQLAALITGQAQDFFHPNGEENTKSIQKFISELRHERPGLILKYVQAETFLRNSYLFCTQQRLSTKVENTLSKAASLNDNPNETLPEYQATPKTHSSSIFDERRSSQEDFQGANKNKNPKDEKHENRAETKKFKRK